MLAKPSKTGHKSRQNCQVMTPKLLVDPLKIPSQGFMMPKSPYFHLKHLPRPMILGFGVMVIATVYMSWANRKILCLFYHFWMERNANIKVIFCICVLNLFYAENLKKSRPKNSWNEVNKFHVIFFGYFPFSYGKNSKFDFTSFFGLI